MWVEDPNMRPSFSQVICMLNAFIFTPPPSPPSILEEPESNESMATSKGTVSSLYVRAKGRFAFPRQLFAAKKMRTSQ
ncbi:unnamed protein product [Rhodiola kirilowii]